MLIRQENLTLENILDASSLVAIGAKCTYIVPWIHMDIICRYEFVVVRVCFKSLHNIMHFYGICILCIFMEY